MQSPTAITPNTIERLLGRTLTASGAALDGRDAVSGLERLAAPASAPLTTEGMLATGIKPVDLYAPIPRGGLVAIVGGSGVGKVVLTTEIVRRAIDSANACGVWAARSYAGFGLNDIVGENRAAGIDEALLVIGAEHTDTPEQQAQAGMVALTVAQLLAARGRETFLLIDEALASPEVIGRITNQRSVTTLAWINRELAPDEGIPEHPIIEHADSVIVLNRQLAVRNIWPAFDPLRSRSALLRAGQAHERAVGRAQALLRAHENLDATENADVGGGLAGRARRLLRYQMQPFFVAEAFTATPAMYVPLEQTLRDVERLLDGAFDERPESEVTFIGALPE